MAKKNQLYEEYRERLIGSRSDDELRYPAPNSTMLAEAAAVYMVNNRHYRDMQQRDPSWKPSLAFAWNVAGDYFLTIKSRQMEATRRGTQRGAAPVCTMLRCGKPLSHRDLVELCATSCTWDVFKDDFKDATAGMSRDAIVRYTAVIRLQIIDEQITSMSKSHPVANGLSSGHVSRHISSRLTARLERLSHEALLELWGRTCLLAPQDCVRATDHALALHNPLPSWAVDGALLSSDLAPRMMGALEWNDGAAAVACKAWRDAWEATRTLRRKLHPAPLKEVDLHYSGILNRPHFLAALPGERLCLAGYTVLWIVDKNMELQNSIGGDVDDDDDDDEDDGVAFDGICGVVAGDDGLYVSDHSSWLRRLDTHNFEVLAEYEEPRVHNFLGFLALALAPGRYLFVVAVVSMYPQPVEIIAVDPLTLEMRHAFGRAVLNGANGTSSQHAAEEMTVIGEELYVADSRRDCLHVFSFDGQHLRDLRGDWGAPTRFCFVEDRIYLAGTQEGEPGGQIYVLTFDGVTLQRYTPEAELPDEHEVDCICYFDGQLIVSHSDEDGQDQSLFALQGL